MDEDRSVMQIMDEHQPSRRSTWIAIGILWVIGLALGFTGLAQHARLAGQRLSALDLVYRLLQLVTLESGAVSPPIPWALEIARFCLPALAAWTVVRAVMHLFREQVRRAALLFWRNHLIVAGLSRTGFSLASEMAAAGRKVVVIERQFSHPWIAACRQQGIVVLNGDATNPTELRRAQIRRASALIAATGDDAANADVAVKANEIMMDLHRSPLHCIVHIVNPSMWDLLRGWEIAQDKFEAIRLELFNIYMRGADFLIDEYNLASDQPGQDDSPPILLIIGLGRLSEHLIIQAARKWFSARRNLDKMEIVVVDPLAPEKLDLLAVRFPALLDSAEVIPVPIEAASAAFEKGEVQIDKSYSLALIDLPDDGHALATALTIKRLLVGRSTSVAIHMLQSGGILHLLATLTGTSPGEPELRPFTLVERVCDRHFLDQGTHERLARALHQSYLDNRRANSTWDPDDPALQSWEKLPHDMQASNRAQADFMGAILLKSGHELALMKDWSQPPFQFDELEIEKLARSEHERWRGNRLQQGWRYAPGPKNDAKRTHPDLIEWDELPEGEREKNRAFIRNWPVILHQAGFMITAGEDRG